MEAKNHGETIHGTKAPDPVSWHAPHLTESPACVQKTGLPRTAAVRQAR